MINHKLDLEARIQRLETLRIQTKHELRNEKLDEQERVTLHARYNNCVYLKEMYQKRIDMLEAYR